MPLAGFTAVNELTELEDNRILLVGQSAVMNTKGRKDNVTLSGRAVILIVAVILLPIFMQEDKGVNS